MFTNPSGTAWAKFTEEENNYYYQDNIVSTRKLVSGPYIWYMEIIFIYLLDWMLKKNKLYKNLQICYVWHSWSLSEEWYDMTSTVKGTVCLRIYAF